MDPPNVLWFAGTYVIASASYALLNALPKSQSSLWIFLAALALLLVYSAASPGLLRNGWWVPGGLAAALAVAMIPAVGPGLPRVDDGGAGGLPVTNLKRLRRPRGE